MNLPEQELDYPFGDALPETGATIEIAPNIQWQRMGLPFALNHINLWLLRDEMDDPRQTGTNIHGWPTPLACRLWISATDYTRGVPESLRFEPAETP
ncbi:MAG: hypothetical protein H7228_12070 [Polaromonas sp.]|nr:hypothetical protein [Polaromonas sp.]